MKYTSQHRCDKTMDDKMSLYRECCFPNCGNRPYCPPLDPPLSSACSLQVFCTIEARNLWCSYNKVTQLCRLLFRQQDEINSVVRRVYLAITIKLAPTE